MRAERGRPLTEGPGALSGCRPRGRGPPGNALRKRVSGASSPLCLQGSPVSGPPRQELQNLGQLPGPGRRPALQSRAQWGSLLVPYLQLWRLRPGSVPRGHPLAGEGPGRRAPPQGAGLLPSRPACLRVSAGDWVWVRHGSRPDTPQREWPLGPEPRPPHLPRPRPGDPCGLLSSGLARGPDSVTAAVLPIGTGPPSHLPTSCSFYEGQMR